MTPSPVVEALLVVLAGVVVAWLVTYLAHSTLAIAGAALFTRAQRVAPIDRARLWRFVIVAPFLTATLQMTGIVGAPAVSWNVASLLPQPLVDWRLGIVGLSLLAAATATVVAGWIAGALVFRRAIGRRRPAPASLQHEMASLATLTGGRVPRVTLSDRTTVPAAVGLSEVCVPASSLEAMPSDERQSLLAHELGHLAARDPVWLAIASSLSRLAPFQPLNAWAITQLRAASEEAADDFSVRVTGDPAPLARALTRLASIRWVLPGGVAASGSPVVVRVSRLLGDPPPAPWRRGRRWLAAAAVFGCLLAAAPGLSGTGNHLANRLPWLTPGKAPPNARMLELRRFERTLRDTVRRAIR